MNSLSAVHLWSAVPTPLNNDLEGPGLQDRERSVLVKTSVAVAQGKLKIAAQVSDNSVPRILDKIARMADAGADFGIIAHNVNKFIKFPLT